MNKDQYETAFLPNEESKTYIKERDKIYLIADMAYCANCEDLVDFSVQDEIIEENFRGKQIRYPFQTGRCKCCRNEVPTDLVYNDRKANAKWKACTEVRKKEI